MQKTNDTFIKQSVYTKAIAISPENLEWIKKLKNKKSAAGRLNEIIEFYKKYGALHKQV
jgi:hypothetical protein